MDFFFRRPLLCSNVADSVDLTHYEFSSRLFPDELALVYSCCSAKNGSTTDAHQDKMLPAVPIPDAALQHVKARWTPQMVGLWIRTVGSHDQIAVRLTVAFSSLAVGRS